MPLPNWPLCPTAVVAMDACAWKALAELLECQVSRVQSGETYVTDGSSTVPQVMVSLLVLVTCTASALLFGSFRQDR